MWNYYIWTSGFTLSPKTNKKRTKNSKKCPIKMILPVSSPHNEEDCDFIKEHNSFNYLKSYKKEEKNQFKDIFFPSFLAVKPLIYIWEKAQV